MLEIRKCYLSSHTSSAFEGTNSRDRPPTTKFRSFSKIIITKKHYIMTQYNMEAASDISPNYFIRWNDAVIIKETIHAVGWRRKCGNIH